MKWLTGQKMHLLAALMLATVILSPAVYAIGPTITATVYDGRPGELVITSPTSNTPVSGSLVKVEGTLHNIGQIMVYLDGAYSMTHPIDIGATTFSFETSASVGRHTLKLVGINPFDGTTIEESVSFTVTAAAVEQLPRPVGVIADTAGATTDFMQDQIDQASETPPAAVVGDIGYKIMKSLDLMPTNGPDEATKMAVRFWSVSTGTAFLIMTQPMIGLYHLVRYRLMEWNVHALPNVLHLHATAVLRVGGLILIAAGFFI